MSELLEPKEFAKALATAFIVDIDNSPMLKESIASGNIGPIQLKGMISRDIRSSSPLFTETSKVVKKQASLQSGMGQDWVSSLSNAIAGVAVAATTYLAGKKVVESEKDKADAIVQATEAAKQLATRQAAIDTAKSSLSPPASGEVAIPGVGNVPIWGIAAGGLAVVIGGILLFRR
jgi:hypothetical protein